MRQSVDRSRHTNGLRSTYGTKPGQKGIENMGLKINRNFRLSTGLSVCEQQKLLAKSKYFNNQCNNVSRWTDMLVV